MKRYMVLALCLLLLALTACGGKTAQDAEETPGDPTGSVRLVPAQEETLPPQEEAQQSGQQTAAEGGTQQAEKPAAPQEPAQQPQQSAQTPAQSGTEKPEEDIWYEGIGYLPSGQEMVRRSSTYKPDVAAQAGNDYLVSKGLSVNSALQEGDCGIEWAKVDSNAAFLSGGTAYLTERLKAAVDRLTERLEDPSAYDFCCHGRYNDYDHYYYMAVWYSGRDEG